jgi:hypothetical protein
LSFITRHALDPTNIKLRLAFRDSENDVIQAGSNKLTSTFNIRIEAPTASTGCEDSKAVFEGGATDKTVSLASTNAGEYLFKDVVIERPLEVSFHYFHGSCRSTPRYILEAKLNNEWKEWYQWEESVRYLVHQ